MSTKRYYPIGEFSEKTNTSIRTLHYYDEIGILVPYKNPETGHRLYQDADLLKLQKIVSLKFIGCSLEQIKTLMNEPSFNLDLKQTLQVQRNIFEQERERIDQALKAIERTIIILEDEGEVDSTVLASLIHGMQTEKEHRDWLEKFAPKEIVDEMYSKPDEEYVAMDKLYIQFSKKVKELIAYPPTDPRVQELVGEYLRTTFQFIGEEGMQSLATIDMEEAEKFASQVISPFSKEEEQWLDQAIEHFTEQNGWDLNSTPNPDSSPKIES